MLKTKFEAKSKRVKGLSFHKYRPWILASLHNGSINLFDYRAAVLLEKFEDHDGPVRGVNFHETQPLFVSGGDDHKVKVWNYKTKKCLFTLTGHLDYIRTVEFHKELPWICSSSDDQTIRIWNWQNRSVIAILTGHSHYVMSATFHPEETLLASSSLDQTIRIWDFSRLKEKSMQKQGSRPNEIFGGTEVEVKHIIEGHEKGVNWVAFHPTMKIVASGADDKTIKLWRLSGNKHWEMDTLKGHANNVSCCIFHPRMEVLISNSEDKTLRVWDLNRRVQIHQMRKDTDRFWILAAHPSLNYFAAGYDNGMMVFKLERENYASARMGSYIFFVKNKNLYYHDLTTKEKTIMAPVNTNGKQVMLNQPKAVYYNYFNQSSHDIILNFDVEGGCFIIYEFHRDLKQIKCVSEKRGDYTQAAVFLSKDKICVLDQNKELAVCNFDGSNLKKFQVNKKGAGKVEMIHPGPLGKVLIQADDTLMLYDIAARKVMHEVAATDVKQVYWNSNFTNAAIVTKTQLIMVNKNLEIINSQKENAKIKTGCFDENNAFIYSTSTHIKYMFCEGKTTGTFKSLDEPVYTAFFMKNQAYAFNRQGDLLTLEVNNTDYLFKLALAQKNLNEVKEILSQGNLCGHSIVSYLKEQGHSEIALFFEQDLKQRFNLAIASGNIQVAFDAAKELKEKDNFLKLAQTALLLGNYEITEKCYQIIRSLDKLNFFYASTGSINKIRKMQAVAQSINDHTLRFNTAIFSGDIHERVKVLAETGQIPLAYLMAKSHGLAEFEKALEESIRAMEGVDQEKIFEQAQQYARQGKALLPLRPLYVTNETYQSRDWPMTNLRAKEAERAAQMFQKSRQPELAESDDMFFDAKEFHTSNKQVANILSSGGAAGTTTTGGEGEKTVQQSLQNVDNANWGDDEELDIDADNILDEGLQGDDIITNGEVANAAGAAGDSDIFVPPSQGADPLQVAVRKNPLVAGLHVAVGDFQKALELLKKQLAVKNFEPLKQIFVDAHTLGRLKIQTLPHISPIDYQLRQASAIPQVVITLNSILSKYNKGVDLTTKGEFSQALDTFRQCIQSIPLTVVTSQKEQKELQELIRKISEYITAMRIELERKKVVSSGADNVRATELSCYMTLCAMDVAHKFLAYKNAMNNNYKMQNFITAANFARLVLDLEPTGIFASKPDTIAQFKKYFQAFQQKGTNAQKLKYDPNLNVELKEINGYLCIGTLTPLEDNKSQSTVRCPLDGSIYYKNQSGKICDTCQLCKLGEDAIGLTNLMEVKHLE